MPALDLVRLPVPEMMPPYEMLSDRLKARVPLFVMLPVTEPVVPPLPMVSVPSLIVVPPV